MMMINIKSYLNKSYLKSYLNNDFQKKHYLSLRVLLQIA